MTKSFAEKIITLKGPILIVGASGFIGANLLNMLLKYRNDIFGTVSHLPNWRLENIDSANIIEGDLLAEENLENLLNRVKPKTIFNCVAYGAYSFQNDIDLIYKTNVTFTARLIEACYQREVDCLIHAGSSSEYGDNAAAPKEESALNANSHYAVTKATTSNLIYFYGKKKGMKVANLRLYSIYGPYEDSSRLIPKVVLRGLEKKFSDFTNPEISRDFVYIDDACEAFIDTAFNLTPNFYGESFNIGSGVKTTINDIAKISKEIYQIAGEPQFNYPAHQWDVSNWYSNPKKAQEVLGWRAKISLPEGLQKMTAWVQENFANYSQAISTKKPVDDLDRVHSISAIIACYKDAQAIPEMYQRITNVMKKLKLDYEIIFVNDCSPDNSEEIIAEISRSDWRVIGISHSRNFGSQAAFKSGLDLATKNSCVLMDGDLQDPPEMIEQFLQKWKEGFEVVYGRRIKRDAPFYMQIFYKIFYRLFAAFSYINIPKDAGDFALMDKKVVEVLLCFPERDLFLRGLRAYAGFKQAGIDYVRPERKFGRTTNNIFKNIGWAKKGIFSFSYVPLNLLSAFGWLTLFLSGILMIIQISLKYFFPDSIPHGVTTTLILLTFFGSLNLFAVSILGEYIAKIFEEVKGRPHFIRNSIIRRGNISGTSGLKNILGRK
ncbi:MAG: NAD-dependent epimerase/dehydratase family protein [Proteobacteria bacterium]|nr:NAD-dependent epimerase/dehydratase family protein [Pseudomonadota bacterium]